MCVVMHLLIVSYVAVARECVCVCAGALHVLGVVMCLPCFVMCLLCVCLAFGMYLLCGCQLPASLKQMCLLFAMCFL